MARKKPIRTRTDLTINVLKQIPGAFILGASILATYEGLAIAVIGTTVAAIYGNKEVAEGCLAGGLAGLVCGGAVLTAIGTDNCTSGEKLSIEKILSYVREYRENRNLSDEAIKRKYEWDDYSQVYTSRLLRDGWR
jgi:hypothetical protein